MASEETIRRVYTCGLCEQIYEEIEINHECLEGYSNVFIDENHYFYPTSDNGQTIVRRSLMPNNEEQLITERRENLCPNNIDKTSDKTSSGNETVKSKRLTDLEIELLILEVQKRKPLWDFSLPLEQRSRDIVKRLWNEVSNELNGKISSEEAKKKFKSLRDTHRKIIQFEKHPSGSARSAKEKWKHYNIMEFLRDSCLIEPTATNIANNWVDVNLEETPSLSIEPTDDESTQTVHDNNTRKRKCKNADETVTALNKIADYLNKDDPPIALPAPPNLDEVEAMLHAGVLQLRRLPYKIRMKTAIDVLQFIYSKVQQYVDDD